MKFAELIRLVRSSEPRDRILLRQTLHGLPIIRSVLARIQRLKARFTQRSPDDYVRMQKSTYEAFAAADHVEPGLIDGDFVVGSWRQHDEWEDFGTYLMKYVPPGNSWTAIEYGCGPGRNIRRWTDSFARIDGVDISATNLQNARTFLEGQILRAKMPNLFLTDGMDCGEAPKAAYDFAFSTICLQHICVYDVRFSILRSLFECLRPGGRLSIQMGFGVPSPQTVPYRANFVQAAATNRGCDVAIASPDEVGGDLAAIGFTDFECWIRPTGPGDYHPNWIFFTGVKPLTPAVINAPQA